MVGQGLADAAARTAAPGHRGETPFILSIDETGDRKLETRTFPLLVRVLKPHARLKAGAVSHTTPPVAVEIVEDLRDRGFPFHVVVAASLSGESPECISALQRLQLQEVAAIRSTHAVWLLPWPAGAPDALAPL
jgi:hypothetical protein